MTNDLNTIGGSLQQCIDELEDNLQSMGVDASFDISTGLNGLVDEILNIEASMGGIDLVTALSCNTSKDSIFLGDSIQVTGVLEADKDDTSQTNVDLEGYLKGATIKIYNGNNVLGTAITNNKGEYIYTYTPLNTGSLSIHSVFEGTSNYDSCNSNNVTVTVEESFNITLTKNKNILSYGTNDTLTLTAETDASDEIAVKFYKDDTLLDTITTNNNIATYTYNATGEGNINFHCEYESITSNNVTVEDILYYNDGSSTTGLEIGGGVSCTSDGEWITITTSTSGEKFVFPPRPINCFTGSENWELSFQFNPNSYTTQAFGLQMEYCSSGSYVGNSAYTSWGGSFNNCMGYGNKSVNGMSTDSIVTFRRLNGNWILLVDGVEQLTRSMSWSDKWVPGFYTNNGRVQHLRNIKIKYI